MARADDEEPRGDTPVRGSGVGGAPGPASPQPEAGAARPPADDVAVPVANGTAPGTNGSSPVLPGAASGAHGTAPGPSDAELLARVRGQVAGAASTEAFGVLYARHLEAARALARQLARSPADADDLVAGAFARLLEVLRGGGGPTEAFRAYLLTALRHLAYDRTRAERRLDLTDEIGDVVGVDPERTIVPFTDPAVAGLERSLAARAFATLPERWQAVLWHLEVEGDTPADIAPLFGLTANAVSALGYRAREGLRQAYLQEHLSAGSSRWDRAHRETSEKLGAYTRGGLSRRDAGRVEAHLAECEECRSLAGELREVNSGLLRAVIGPLVLGGGLLGYLAARASDTGELIAGGAGGAWGPATTGELAVAGGGVLGLFTTLGDVVRPALLTAVPGGLAVALGLGLGGTPAPPPTGPPATSWVPPPASTPPPVPPAAAPGVPGPGGAGDGSAFLSLEPTRPGSPPRRSPAGHSPAGHSPAAAAPFPPTSPRAASPAGLPAPGTSAPGTSAPNPSTPDPSTPDPSTPSTTPSRPTSPGATSPAGVRPWWDPPGGDGRADRAPGGDPGATRRPGDGGDDAVPCALTLPLPVLGEAARTTAATCLTRPLATR